MHELSWLSFSQSCLWVWPHGCGKNGRNGREMETGAATAEMLWRVQRRWRNYLNVEIFPNKYLNFEIFPNNYMNFEIFPNNYLNVDIFPNQVRKWCELAGRHVLTSLLVAVTLSRWWSWCFPHYGLVFVCLVFVFAEFILNITVSGCNSVMSRRNFCTLWPSDGVLLVFVYTVVVLLFLVFSSMRFRTIVVVVVFIQLMIFLSSSRYWSTCMLLLTSRRETNAGSLKSGTENLVITCRLHHKLWLIYLVRDHHYFDGYGLWVLIIIISTRLTSPSGTESQLLALRPLDNSISGLSDFCQIHI